MAETQKIRRIGLMIPEFPEQTHIAWWRVGNSIREKGVDVQMLSTRIPRSGQVTVHPCLYEESKSTFYAWPVSTANILSTLVRSPVGVGRAYSYLNSLPETDRRGKIALLPVLLSAFNLYNFCQQQDIEHIFVHSCANAAHLAAMCHLIGGPNYSLRLGGDLEVYGKDHAAKMSHASFIFPGARSYIPRLIDEVGVPADKIFWTWVGVDIRAFTPKETINNQTNNLHIVTIARLNPTKGHKYILTALQQLKNQGLNIKYTIAGTGGYEPELREMVRAQGLEDRVIFAGALSQSHVVELLHRADMFVLASFGRGESTPAVVSEAMACQLPVICTQIGGVTDMIEDGISGVLVPQEDAGAIAAAIADLAHHPERRHQIAETARQHSQKFDCRGVADLILKKIFKDEV